MQTRTCTTLIIDLSCVFRTLKGKIAKQYPEAFSSELELLFHSLFYKPSQISWSIVYFILFRYQWVICSGGWRWWVWHSSPQCCHNNHNSHLRAEYRVLQHKPRCDFTHCEQMLWRSLPRASWHTCFWCPRDGCPTGWGSWFCTCRIDWSVC